MLLLLLLRRQLTALFAFLRLVTFRATGMVILELATFCIYLVVSSPGKQPLAEPPPAASKSGKQNPTTGAVDLSAERGCDPRGSGVCCCCCCCFDDDCPCLFTFGHISYWHDQFFIGYPMCTYTSYMGSCTAIRRLNCCILQCCKGVVSWLVLVALNG